MRSLIERIRKCTGGGELKLPSKPGPASASLALPAPEAASTPPPLADLECLLLALLTDDELELILSALPLADVLRTPAICRRFRKLRPIGNRAVSYLVSIQERIGRPPRNPDGSLRPWQQEWTTLKVEQFRLSGQDQFATREYVEKNSSVSQMIERFHRSIGDMVEFGWPRHRAETVALLTTGNAALGRALREKDPCYGAAVHAISLRLFEQREAQKQVPQMMYTHLKGRHSLMELDQGWKDADQPGFKGLLAYSVTNCTRVKNNFTETGYALYINRNGKGSFDPVDSDVVAFESAPDDNFGCHMAILGAHANSARFPPLTYFTFQRVVPPGKWQAPGGLYPRQRLIVMRATYAAPPTPSAASACELASTADGPAAAPLVEGAPAAAPPPPLRYPRTAAEEQAQLEAAIHASLVATD